FAQSETRRLEELHAGLTADWIDERLNEGETPIAELESAIAREPLWERPRGQLMRALYLAGRQADALELYRRTRELLTEQLRVEPGAEPQRPERPPPNQAPELGAPGRPRGSFRPRRPVRLIVLGGLLAEPAAAAAVTLIVTRGGSSQSLPYLPDSLVRVDGPNG